jgi:hypothetical protein
MDGDMTLDQWAARWSIPAAALLELETVAIHEPERDGQASESRVQSEVRLEAAALGIRLFRNNVGGGKLENGKFMRWGLANDSKALNKVVKSGDLIGIRKIIIEPCHVGRAIGQFVSREIKRGSWQYRGTEEEKAQTRWALFIKSMGGDAAITNGKGSFYT